MIGRLKNLFNMNKKEKEILEKSNLSKKVIDDRKEIINHQNDVIDNYSKVYEVNAKKIKQLEIDRDSGKITESYANLKIDKLNKQINEAERLINCEKQGKIKDIISTYFNQFDKRVYNKFFEKETPKRNKIWNIFKRSKEDRYSDLNGYVAKNVFISIIVAIISIIGGVKLPALGFVFKGLTGINACFALNTIVKGISTYFNNKKFGGIPEIMRKKKLYTGNYKENIKTAKYAYDKSIMLTSDKKIEVIKDSISSTKNTIEENKHNNVIATNKKLNNNVIDEDIELVEDEFLTSEPLKNNSVSLGIQLSDNNMSYLGAYSTIRKSSDHDERIDAYTKLATTFGKNNKKKKDTEIEKLNYYSRRLKALSEYGRKINEGSATKEEQELYLALLYNLGKDFDEDDVMDYLSEVYEQERQKVYKKAS